MTTLHDRILAACEWSLKNTSCSEWPRRVVTRGFNADCGHSGASIIDAVVKTGDVLTIGDEVRYASLLGVGPEILGEWSGGYAMRRLYGTPGPDDLLRARKLLEENVWSRESPTVYPMWDVDLTDRLNLTMTFPDWVLDEERRMSHGDPTLGNVIVDGGVAYLLDPKPPGRGIPSMISVDRGKFLQSMLGWEQHRTGNWWPEQRSPLEDLSDVELRRSIWWCQVHLRRIMQRETASSSTYLWADSRRAKLEEILECATS